MKNCLILFFTVLILVSVGIGCKYQTVKADYGPDYYITKTTGINTRGERIHGKLFIGGNEIHGQPGELILLNGRAYRNHGDQLWGLSGWHPLKQK